jgi:GNAT superfamily N-acetyltransferase
VPSDVPEILSLIRELAVYEREPHAVQASEQQLTEALFGGAATPSGQPAVHCHVVEHEGRVGGMALWFLNFSTWLGRHGIYLEDLYVRPELRGRGYGRQLLATLARLCVERGYGRLEWWVLDWNAPAIGFYRSLGAIGMDDWTVYRLTGAALERLAHD